MLMRFEYVTFIKVGAGRLSAQVISDQMNRLRVNFHEITRTITKSAGETAADFLSRQVKSGALFDMLVKYALVMQATSQQKMMQVFIETVVKENPEPPLTVDLEELERKFNIRCAAYLEPGPSESAIEI